MIALCVFLNGCAQTRPKRPIVEHSLAAWGPIKTISDRALSIQVAPEIGRVLHVSRPGEPNLLWTSPAPDRPGTTPWVNYGGDKLWPWPQQLWSWPPPKTMDPGPFQLTYSATSFQILGRTDPHTGLQTIRATSIQQGTATNTYTLTRRAAPATQPVSACAAWSVAQVPATAEFFIRRRDPASTPTRMDGAAIQSKSLNEKWTQVIVPNARGKLGLAGDAIAVRLNDRVLLIERLGGEPLAEIDRAVEAQIFFYVPEGNAPPLFAEVEFIGPRKTLGLAESVELQTRWRVLTAQEFGSPPK